MISRGVTLTAGRNWACRFCYWLGLFSPAALPNQRRRYGAGLCRRPMALDDKNVIYGVGKALQIANPQSPGNRLAIVGLLVRLHKKARVRSATLMLSRRTTGLGRKPGYCECQGTTRPNRRPEPAACFLSAGAGEARRHARRGVAEICGRGSRAAPACRKWKRSNAGAKASHSTNAREIDPGQKPAAPSA